MTKHKIVLLPFPYDDLTGVKIRPALCLTNPVGSLRHVVVAYISSKEVPEQFPSDVMLPASHPEFKSTGLMTSSTIRLHHVITMRASTFRRELGRLPAELAPEVEAKIKALFN